MKTEALQRVSVIDALSTGLIEAARRPWLILIPLITELVTWLAPQFSVGKLLESQMRSPGYAEFAALQTNGASSGILPALNEMATQFVARINLLEGIAGGWLGSPLAAWATQITRMTFLTDLVMEPAGLAVPLPRMIEAPWRGAPVEIADLAAFLVFTAGFWFVGQVLAAVYLRWAARSWRTSPPLPATAVTSASLEVGRRSTTAQAAVKPALRVRPAAPAALPGPWPGMRGVGILALRLMLYSLLVGMMVTVLQLPLLLAVWLLSASGSSVIGMLMLLFGGVALWLTLWFLVSLFYVTEAIVLDEQPILRAMLRSMVLVHSHFWPTLGLVVLVNLLMYGFRAVWGLIGHSVPGAAIAIATNAYLATSMLLAIFGFYENLSRQARARRVVGSKA